MQTIVMILVAFVREIVLSRATLRLENIALRQQVAVLKRERQRPRLHPLDRVFWVFLRRLWPCWKDALVIVKPETVVGWHRQGFRLFWKWKSCHAKPGRPQLIRPRVTRFQRRLFVVHDLHETVNSSPIDTLLFEKCPSVRH